MMTHSVLDADAIWEDVLAVRRQSPLVHSISNFVVVNYNANALLALGAAPVMAHAHEEVREMAGLAQALVVNIGTLDPYWVASMELAWAVALAGAKPIVFDPVGVGATPYRDAVAQRLLGGGSPAAVRGNASEIMNLAGFSAATKGVESLASSGQAVEAALSLASALRCVVCVSGADDHVVDGAGRWLTLSNGHEWMTQVTGMGCSATAVVAAFAAVQADPWRATASAMAYFGVAGEWAAQQALQAGGGAGTLQIRMLDGLQLLTRDEFIGRLKLEVRHGGI